MMRKIVIAMGAFVSAVLGYAALQVAGLTAAGETPIVAVLLGLAVLAICVTSYFRGVQAKRSGSSRGGMGRTPLRPEKYG